MYYVFSDCCQVLVRLLSSDESIQNNLDEIKLKITNLKEIVPK